jgi:magnesium-transporting ATPase (P-type)
LIGGATLMTYFLARANGVGEAQRQTLAVTMLAMGQVGYLFSCRNLRGSSLRLDQLFTNRIAWLSVAALLLFQSLYVYAPVMHTLFGSTPLDASGWGVTFAAAGVIFLVVEAGKAALRRRGAAADRPTE